MMSREAHHGAFATGQSPQNVRFRDRIGRRRRKHSSIPPPYRAGTVPGFLLNLKVARHRRRRTGLSKQQPTQEHPAARGLSPVSCHRCDPRTGRKTRGLTPSFFQRRKIASIPPPHRAGTVPGFLPPTRTASEGHATVGAAAVLRLVPRSCYGWCRVGP